MVSGVTVLEVIRRTTEFFQGKGIDSPRLQAELLVADELKMPRLRLYLDFERTLDADQLARLREKVRRRARGEPLQLILGTANFCGFELRVTRGVLIPRPETEVLAEAAWEWLKASPGGQKGRVLDLGTGSGCLAIALALKCPDVEVWAADVSEAAIEVAKENIRRHGLQDRVRLLQGDGFGALPAGLRFEAIVSNPPYIPDEEIASLPPEVRDWEPRVALAGGKDGLAVIRRLAAEGRSRLKPEGRLFMEFADGQEAQARRIFEEAGWKEVEIRPDLSGSPRILIAAP